MYVGTRHEGTLAITAKEPKAMGLKLISLLWHSQKATEAYLCQERGPEIKQFSINDHMEQYTDEEYELFLLRLMFMGHVSQMNNLWCPIL